MVFRDTKKYRQQRNDQDYASETKTNDVRARQGLEERKGWGEREQGGERAKDLQGRPRKEEEDEEEKWGYE